MVSVPVIRHARARTATRSAEDSSAHSSSTERPGRSSHARTRTSATGTGPRMSKATRASAVSGRGEQRSSSRTSRAEGGPRCWLCADHGPAVCRVDRYLPSPSGW